MPDLLGVALAGLVIGIAGLGLFDGVLAFLGVAEFGRANGWLAVILPVWLFAEEFRAWRNGTRVRRRAGRRGCGDHLRAARRWSRQRVPPLASGGVAATVFTFGYALIWFHGVRWLARS